MGPGGNKPEHGSVIRIVCAWGGQGVEPQPGETNDPWERLIKELESGGITIRAGSMAGLAEEAPQAYKDVDSVVESVVGADLAHKVARLRPVVVIKG